MNPLVSLFVVSLRVVTENVVTDRQTHLQTTYRNSRCACAPRVNKYRISNHIKDGHISMVLQEHSKRSTTVLKAG